MKNDELDLGRFDSLIGCLWDNERKDSGGIQSGTIRFVRGSGDFHHVVGRHMPLEWHHENCR